MKALRHLQILWLALFIFFNVTTLRAQSTNDSPQLKTGADYFNAANALYKQNKILEAVAYYEKALRLSGGNSDIKYNLKLATKSAPELQKFNNAKSFYQSIFVPLAKTGLTFWICIVFVISSIAFTLSYFKSVRSGGSKLFVAIFGSIHLLFFILCLGCLFAKSTSEAVIYAPAFPALRSGPGTTFTEVEKLPVGLVVNPTGNTKEDWIQIQVTKDSTGWIEKKDVLEL